MERCDIEAVSAFIDGELPEESAARLCGHIENCPSCRALRDDLTALKEGFAALGVPAPDTLAPGVMYKISLPGDPPRKNRMLRSLVAIAACAAAVFIITRVPGTEKFLAPRQIEDTVNLFGAESAMFAPAPGGGAEARDEANDPQSAPFPAEDMAEGDSVLRDAQASPAAFAGEAEGFGYEEFLELLSMNRMEYEELDSPLEEREMLYGTRFIKIGKEPHETIVYTFGGLPVVLYIGDNEIGILRGALELP
jgi:hypothetical protein